MDLLIKNGWLLDPATHTNGYYDLLIRAGKIAEVAPHLKKGELTKVINAAGLIITPGFIDLHVHLRDPGQEHKENIETGSRAAAHGGFTSIACMPNTSPVNDSVAVTEYILKRAQEVGLVNVFPVAAISKNLASEELSPMEELVGAGVRGFSDDGRCLMNENLLKQALIRAKTLKVPVIEHPEDHNLSLDGQVNAGDFAENCQLKGIPAASEDVIIARDLKWQGEINSYLHLTHISTQGAVNLLAAAKKGGVRVSSDVTPHHLLLDETMARCGDANYKMKPPLRALADRKAMITGIQTGIIDCIATDHAPHSPEEKNRPFQETPFGITGLETAFPLIYDRLVLTHLIDLELLVKLFATHPARVMFLEERGMVKPGLPADLTLLNLNHRFKIHQEDFYSRSVNSPFIGWEGEGVVEMTIVNGTVAYRRQAAERGGGF